MIVDRICDAVFGTWQFCAGCGENVGCARYGRLKVLTNTEALGQVIYTDYVLAFQLAGLDFVCCDDWRDCFDACGRVRVCVARMSPSSMREARGCD